MQAHTSVSRGFRDPVRQSQSVFRAAMQAMSRPGEIVKIQPGITPPPPLSASSAALLLTLCDFETPVWLDPELADTVGVRDFLSFHTGARIVAASADAAFAVVSDGKRMPAIASFAQGTQEYPDRSTTLIIGVRTLGTGRWKLTGPGIRDHATVSAEPLPADFAGQLRANRAQFPRGVDIFLTTPDAIVALPRSVTLTEVA
jgi:alpha-D-ribose 1-methylphosphonate 5-triphosphate synthase subunit PhnH